MKLQHVTLQSLVAEDNGETFEGYMRVEHQFERRLPATVCILSACLVPVSQSYCMHSKYAESITAPYVSTTGT